MSKYSFGWGEEDAAVEVPELDALSAELDAVLRKYGVGFRLESYPEGGGYLVVVPYDRGDAGFFDNLEDYACGVPFLDEAKTRYLARYKVLRDRALAVGEQK